jgi:hypothetical protein
VIDSEAVICGTDGKSDFDRLHSGAHDAAVFLFGFDLIELDSEDVRPAPLEQRKSKLEKLARAQRRDSVFRASRRSNREGAADNTAEKRRGWLLGRAEARLIVCRRQGGGMGANAVENVADLSPRESEIQSAPHFAHNSDIDCAPLSRPLN